MRLYTLESNGREIVAAEGEAGRLYQLKEVRDMNELICTWDEKKESIGKLSEDTGWEALSPDAYHIVAPIPVPMQDIVCLGVNYREHIEETTEVLDFTKKRRLFIFQKE